jgi:microfibrillar-associated protein 1
MSKASQGFGRDEMTALLGDGMQESLVKPAGWNAKSRGRTDENDVSTLTVAQTAALLKERDAQKQQTSKGGARLRAQKSNHTPQHHALLLEQEQQQQQQQHQKDDEPEGDDESDDEQFTRPKKQQREKAEPQILVRRQKVQPEVVVRPRRRRDDTSSSDDGEEEQPPIRKRRQDSSSSASSSDDDDDDDRRSRLLAKRRQRQQHETTDVITPKIAGVAQAIGWPRQDVQKPERKPASSSSDGASDDDSESSEESDSSEEEEVQVAKPLFVPKHRRNKIASQEEKDQEDEAQKAKEIAREQKRKLESRMMLAQLVAAEGMSKDNQPEVDDEAGGATNDPPDDEDPTDPMDLELERDAWEVRELLRLLEKEDVREAQEAERKEYERRKLMSDEERMEEDKAMGRYQKPGERKPSEGDQNSHMQRYFHRGAFYMDEEEWAADDVRHKAKEYERAATGEDKIDKSKLPEIMQVKGFGLARMGTKYKGLSKEDTTDKRIETLPIVKKNKVQHPK